MNQKIEDRALKSIKELYELGDDGKYEIVERTIFIFSNALLFRKNSKECVDRMMDLGVKHTELGIAMCISLSRADPETLCEKDQKLRSIYITTQADLIKDWESISESSTKRRN